MRDIPYLTLGSPITKFRQESLFYISCKNCDGINKPEEILVPIWREFTDLIVKNVNGQPLTYYGSYLTMGVTTDELPKDKNGQCDAWVKLFIDLFRVQGEDEKSITLVLQATGQYAGWQFLIKDWDLKNKNNNLYGGCYVNSISLQNFPNWYNKDSYLWLEGNFTDAAGAPGQSSDNPKSNFNNHKIVKIAGFLFDPSYGKIYKAADGLDEFDKMVVGFVRTINPGDFEFDEVLWGVDVDGNGQKNDKTKNGFVKYMIPRKNDDFLGFRTQKYRIEF